MEITIAVSAEKIPDLVSWRIMRFLKFEGSHIFAVIEEDNKMFHCVDRGVCFDNWQDFQRDHYIPFRATIKLRCSKEEFYKWFGDLLEKGEIPYSNLQYVGFILPFTRKWLGNKRKKAICSEFVAWILADLAGWKEFEDADFRSPKEVWTMLEEKLKATTTV